MASTFLFGAEVTLVKQWHLSPGAQTKNIEESRKLPQSINQIEIYKSVVNLVETDKIHEVISEGCQGEITNYNHGGWGYKELKAKVDGENYSNILALIPLKLKVKLGKKVKALCGDDLRLIKQHQLAFSDLRGFAMYMQRLIDTRKNHPKKFNAYAKAMLGNKQNSDPVNYARKKALEALEKVRHLLSKRNDSFVRSVEGLSKPMIIIGGLHVDDLKQKLEKNGHKVSVITPRGYQPKDEQLLRILEKQLSKEIQSLEVELFQVPVSFQLNLFLTRNLISWDKLATDIEQAQLERIANNKKITSDLLRSDYDGDGIRDFTLSTMGERTILAAEDSDWDNDGINNLVDSTLGKIEIANPDQRIMMLNSYGVEKINKPKLLKSFEKRKLKLITTEGAGFEILTLVVMDKILEQFPIKNFNLKVIHATKAVVSYGVHSFFSYVTQSQTIEVYTDKLNDYIGKLMKTSYKGASLDKIVNGLAMPIMLHSLGHELGHALKFEDQYQLAKKYGWSWQEEKVHSLYLKSYRLKSKAMKSLYTNFAFNGLTKKDLFKEKKKFEKNFNLLIKGKKRASKPEWNTGTKSKQPEFQMSLLKHHKLPSYYSITKPTEWFAEAFSTCIFRQFIPDSIHLDQATRYEILIGLRVDVVSKRLCKTLL